MVRAAQSRWGSILARAILSPWNLRFAQRSSAENELNLGVPT